MLKIYEFIILFMGSKINFYLFLLEILAEKYRMANFYIIFINTLLILFLIILTI